AGSCVNCIADCKECTKKNSCDLCQSGFFYNNFQCVSVCPNDKYVDNATRTCNDCLAKCKTCSNATDCDTCFLRIELHLIVDVLLIIMMTLITLKLVFHVLIYLLDVLLVIKIIAKHVYRLIFQTEIHVQQTVLQVNGEMRQPDNVQIAQLNVQLALITILVTLAFRI
ncbi:hypothetical protein IMG5_105160, partial [Ichthyophthirius multifiliis]